MYDKICCNCVGLEKQGIPAVASRGLANRCYLRFEHWYEVIKWRKLHPVWNVGAREGCARHS